MLELCLYYCGESDNLILSVLPLDLEQRMDSKDKKQIPHISLHFYTKADITYERKYEGQRQQCSLEWSPSFHSNPASHVIELGPCMCFSPMAVIKKCLFSGHVCKKLPPCHAGRHRWNCTAICLVGDLLWRTYEFPVNCVFT